MPNPGLISLWQPFFVFFRAIIYQNLQSPIFAAQKRGKKRKIAQQNEPKNNQKLFNKAHFLK
jgi:hypothetical protein